MSRYLTTRARTGLLVALVLTASSLAIACGGDSDEDADAGTATATATEANGGSEEAEGEMEITVLLQDNFFEPSEITIPAGTTVEFKYENTGVAIHNMIVRAKDIEGSDFSSELAVNPGDTGEFTGTFTTPGEIAFICSYHLPDMAGTITVE